MAAFRAGQKYSGAYSEAEFSESKVQGLSRDAYNPGPTPNVYVENAKGKNSIDVSRVDDVYSWPKEVDHSWHVKGGFAGRVQRTGRGFTAGPAGNHPVSGTTETQRDPIVPQRVGKSYGIDSPTPDQGSPKGGFKWS